MRPTLPERLSDEVVTLEPLTLAHAPALTTAATLSRDTYALTRVPGTREGMRDYVVSLLAEQERGLSVPYATVDTRTGSVVGGTRFMAIERWSWPSGSPEQRAPGFADAVEIGSTWLSPAAQRTGINTHAKLLMLTLAFEGWGVRRVMLKTDARNDRSRNAILRLGARFDGVLRAHMAGFDGQVRDTAFYSILAGEWADVRARLAGLAARQA